MRGRGKNILTNTQRQVHGLRAIGLNTHNASLMKVDKVLKRYSIDYRTSSFDKWLSGVGNLRVLLDNGQAGKQEVLKAGQYLTDNPEVILEDPNYLALFFASTQELSVHLENADTKWGQALADTDLPEDILGSVMNKKYNLQINERALNGISKNLKDKILNSDESFSWYYHKLKLLKFKELEEIMAHPGLNTTLTTSLTSYLDGKNLMDFVKKQSHPDVWKIALDKAINTDSSPGKIRTLNEIAELSPASVKINPAHILVETTRCWRENLRGYLGQTPQMQAARKEAKENLVGIFKNIGRHVTPADIALLEPIWEDFSWLEKSNLTHIDHDVKTLRLLIRSNISNWPALDNEQRLKLLALGDRKIKA